MTHGAPVLGRRFLRTAHAHVSVLSPHANKLPSSYDISRRLPALLRPHGRAGPPRRWRPESHGGRVAICRCAQAAQPEGIAQGVALRPLPTRGRAAQQASTAATAACAHLADPGHAAEPRDRRLGSRTHLVAHAESNEGVGPAGRSQTRPQPGAGERSRRGRGVRGVPQAARLHDRAHPGGTEEADQRQAARRRPTCCRAFTCSSRRRQARGGSQRAARGPASRARAAAAQAGRV